MTARISQLPEALTVDPDDAEELTEDCLDCARCGLCEVCSDPICVGEDGAAMVDDGYGGDVPMCARCQRQPVDVPEPPRARGPGWCLDGYDWESGPL